MRPYINIVLHMENAQGKIDITVIPVVRNKFDKGPGRGEKERKK